MVLPDNANVQHPTIGPPLVGIVPVSGFDINGIRVTYTPSDDTLSIGLDQPPSGNAGQPGSVIAGDADDNGNDGTVNPAVTAVVPTFEDFPDFGGSESMGAFLDLMNSGTADIIAGYSGTDTNTPKQYQVAQVAVNGGTPSGADFGTPLPQYLGNVYKVNSPAHPNLEFSITHFSELYAAETGKTLSASSVIGLGAFGGSDSDGPIGEAFFPAQTFTIGQATPPQPSPPPPPPPTVLSPTVFINYHENKHINTAHDTLVRAYVLGSSGFNVTQIIPATVTLGGAHPIFSFDRFINSDDWPDATFVFRGTDINLPAGSTEATLTGDLANGTSFSSSVRVYNRNSSFYTPAQNAGVAQREAARAARSNGFVVLSDGSGVAATSTPAAASLAATSVTVPTGTPTIAAESVAATSPRLSRRLEASLSRFAHQQAVDEARQQAAVSIPNATTTARGRIPRALQTSLNRYVRDAGAVNLSTGAAVGPSATGAA